ncbi:hypothetical protein PR048_001916 [Dryococelus australis]|uniref:Uncharacterized protein n=1 Tax=Dryococelus australis TaxID=614101 RepID=A0ABQ9IJE7_9NEOP|nr:hypothetical protein PR048_001916 [Dryococelus australis]
MIVIIAAAAIVRRIRMKEYASAGVMPIANTNSDVLCILTTTENLDKLFSVGQHCGVTSADSSRLCLGQAVTWWMAFFCNALERATRVLGIVEPCTYYSLTKHQGIKHQITKGYSCKSEKWRAAQIIQVTVLFPSKRGNDIHVRITCTSDSIP